LRGTGSPAVGADVNQPARVICGGAFGVQQSVAIPQNPRSFEKPPLLALQSLQPLLDAFNDALWALPAA